MHEGVAYYCVKKETRPDQRSSLRSRRIAGTVKGVTKILSCYFCAPCASVDLAKCLKLFAIRLYFIIVNEKALVLVVYPLPTSEVRTQIC